MLRDQRPEISRSGKSAAQDPHRDARWHGSLNPRTERSSSDEGHKVTVLIEQGEERGYVAFWLILGVCLLACPAIFASSGWAGVATTDAGSPVANATVALHSNSEQPEYHTTTSPYGTFTFAEIKLGSYRVSVEAKGKVWT